MNSTQVQFLWSPSSGGLGWQTLDHDQVDRAPAGNYPDYELFGKDDNGNPKRLAIVEVKALHTGEPYLREDAFNQLRGYAERLIESPDRPEWTVTFRGETTVRGVVTNGRHWHVYDFFHGRCDGPICEFDLETPKDPRQLIEAIGRQELIERFKL